MKILARHLTIDMYKCQTACFDEPKKLIDQMQNLLSESQLEVLSATNQIMPDGHVAIMILFKEGHMTFHASSVTTTQIQKSSLVLSASSLSLKRPRLLCCAVVILVLWQI